MIIVGQYSHRNGLDLLESPRFQSAYAELLAALHALPPYRTTTTKQTSAAHVIAPSAMNDWLTYRLCVLGTWDWQPLTDGTAIGGVQLRSDFRKAGIEVEVQFGNIARYAYDICKMAIANRLGNADVGVLVVAMQRFALLTGSNLAYFERIVRELCLIDLSFSMPLVVLGIEPETWDVATYPSADDAPRPQRGLGRQLELEPVYEGGT